MSAAAVLVITRNGETVKSIPLEGDVVLGRGEGCVIRLDDRAISRQHAVFRLVDGAVQVEKKSEFAPMSVNGTEQTRALVRDADVIAIGPYLMRVTLGKDGQAPPPYEAPVMSDSTLEPLPDLAPPPEIPESGSAAPQAGLEQELSADLPELTVASDIAVSADSPAIASPEGDALPDFNMELGNSLGAQSAGQPEELAIDSAALSMGSAAADEPVETADNDAHTKIAPVAKVRVRLVFAPGTANVTEYDMPEDKDEISLGRGKQCDIVLNDKKSSRKNTLIRRAGLSFTVKDLDSANGTYVNGARVTEQQLTGDDLVKVGGVEFQFKVMSADYTQRAAGFLPVPEEAPASASGMEMYAPSSPMETPDQPAPDAAGAVAPWSFPNQAQALGAAGIPGITGIGPGDLKRMGFIEKLKNFQTLPKKEKIKVGVLAVVLALIFADFMFEEDEPAVATKKAKPAVTAPSGKIDKGLATFATLTPEQQRFVEAQHSLAFDHYRNKEYDKALFELDKIFALINDYLDSRDIERYAREGKRKLEAFEEEKRKKEEDARLKAQIQALVDECGQRMQKKQYEQARELFTQISLLDPDNAKVTDWKREIEAWEEDRRAAEQTKAVQAEINKRAWEVYNEGRALKRQGKFHSAIGTFAKVADIGASDRRVMTAAAKGIAQCRYAIKKLRDPVLAEAKQAEEAQDYTKAFALYGKAVRIDPPHPAGHAGIARIRGILHDRAKLLYTEAVLAESFSDFAVARQKFMECREVAPKDDIYHERSVRKLARYFRRSDVEGAAQ
jgi:pSer/pThr/pTyr-binding forkhead associated (FHA) protein/tetratricopeptide (TPR) repeat protein